MEINYWELRSIVKDIIPRRSILESLEKHLGLVKEKGRKSNYSQFNLETHELVPIQRLLSTEEIHSFLEVSLRAAHCPMPLNADLYDAVRCPFHCLYCLPSGTKILMYDGTKKVIERINVGDRIMSYNPKEQEVEISVVTNKMKRIEKKLIKIQTKSKTVRLTLEHPVFTKRGWTKAKDLTMQDEVLIW